MNIRLKIPKKLGYVLVFFSILVILKSLWDNQFEGFGRDPWFWIGLVGMFVFSYSIDD
jgi:hypothetical protein